MTLDRYVKEHCFESTLLTIDGISGSGKLLLSELTKAIDISEAWSHDYIFDAVPVMAEHLNSDVGALLKTRLDELTYNYTISRGINFRPSDQSCVYRSPRFLRYFRRALSGAVDGEDLKAKTQNMLIPIMVHMSSFKNETMESVFKDRVKMAYVIRNPLLCIQHWVSYVDRIGVDPREFTPHYMYNNVGLPWYINDWEDEYVTGTALDKTIISIFCLMRMLNQKLDTTNGTYFLTSFEDLIMQPESCLKRLRNYIGKGKINENHYSKIARINKIPRKSDRLIKGYWKHYSKSKNYAEVDDQNRGSAEYYKDQCSANVSRLLDQAVEIYYHLNKTIENK